ncbi:putative ATP-dependent RNA helicase TDRD12 isoform X2 [Galleria mellonella]|uniref:RNA helicase n=1 Tax=Galleria mellonella TaxID=7137 RepID=A0ABM3N0H8_GALME|nr:putative ATP-dependent RNA helicase TDRD12 isoform X2 [Galleria mellonella]
MSDSYQIDVLHYLNPHLIWVEVINPPNAEPDEFIFEQIGVYGILPQEITISDDVLSLQTKKCEAWAPTTVLSMNNLFKEATEVWFSPVHIDRRNSLFDNNIHKYGEITVKKQNGKCKLLSKLLIKSGFALNDPCMFLQELSLGMLRTNLTNIQRDEVIKHLTQPNKNKPSKDREKSVKRQTHILQIAKNLESPLTIQNLQRHNQNLDVKYMVKNKIKDLEKCKDVDEKSLGRGVTHKQPEPMQRSSLLRKKLEMSAHVPRHHKQDPASILLATKKFLEANAKIKEDVTSGSSPREPEDTVSEAEDHTGNIEEYKEHSSVKSDENECANKISNMKKTKNANKNSKYKVPEYDMNMEQCVAYGPPGLNPQKLPLKIVPKTSNEVNIVKTLENNEEIEGNYDIHDGLDSAVNVEITNKDQLTLINKDHDEQLETSSAADVKVEGNVDEKDAKSFSEESNIEPSKSVRSKILLKKLRLYKGRISIDSLSLSSDIGKDSSSVTEEDSTKGNEDAERLLEVYLNEVKFFLIKIKEMLKNRANKEMKVQFVVASRIWCDFMESLAKKAPHSVVCIGSFQECVLYSKASTTVNFVKKENKVKTVLEFLEQIVNSKKTVIVCRSNDEVELLEKNLKKHGKIVFGCDNTMTVHDLYDLSKQWNDYEEPLLGPILVCCDGNLTHLNVSDAHYLVHYSLPEMFSMFCKRFSVLNDNYPSIFKTENKNIKIKILLDDSNVEQLPKILNFIKRCTNDVPTFLDEICAKVIEEKDIVKAKKFLPVCDSLLALGECPDFWNCIERHAIFKEYDEPKDWMPKTGIITFKILHVQTAVAYSARLLSNVTKNNTTKYPQTYSTLSLKMGMYYSKESNRQLHGIPKVGDLSAVSIKLNFFARCQVVKILNYYKNGNPNYVLIKLIDEEKLERSRDIYLYYLPEDLRGIETHVVQVRLANVKPKDKDVTFSDLSKEQLKKITEKQEHYMRGTVTLAIGNCVFVDTLEACQDLTSLNETVVTDNFKKTLLDVHAIPNPDHIPKLETLCAAGGLDRKLEEPVAEIVSPLKERPPPRWAHLDTDEMSSVLFGSAENPATFFVRLVKFEDCINLLLKDIEKYVVENPEPVTEVTKGDIVLAKFPDDSTYERARIEEVYNNNRVKSFFVDQGDWRDVPMNELITIPEKFITKLPFQAIECRLIGVKPAGDDWTEFGTNWFCDNCFEDNNGHIKQLYIKYFTKESPQFTGGHKYGVVLIDTNGDDDVLINQLMIDVNLAKENEDELKYFDELKKSADFKKDSQSITSEDDWEKITIPDVKETSKVPLEDFFPKKPIRSVHLVQDSDEDSDQWDINMSSDFASLFKQNDTHKQIKEAEDNVVVNLEKEKEMSEPPKSKALETIEIPKNCDTQVACKNVLKSIKQNTKSQNDKSEIQELDSDDFSSTKDSQVSDIADTTLFNTDTEILSDTSKRPLIIEIDNLRKPKVVWRQNNMIVIIKIQLIGVENYDLEIGKRFMKFFAINDDTKYGFEFELYGVVNDKNYSHSNKGQYILIHLTKVMKKTWLTLTRDGGIKKWIVYDVDSIDTSSDEEEPEDDTTANVIKNIHNQGDTDSDDDLLDDINFKYGRH